MRIETGDFDDPRVRDLLRAHLAVARSQTASGGAHALDLTGLRSPHIVLWTIWVGEELVGCGALKRLAHDHGEVKSMHTVAARRGGGIGGVMLRHIVAAARDGGMSRLSLQTSSWDYFKPAVALYKRHGFVQCPPFADYVEDPNSVYLSLDLDRLPEAEPRA